MKYEQFKIIQLKNEIWTDDTYYPCNTSGLMDAETRLIYRSNREWLESKKIKYRVIQRRVLEGSINFALKTYSNKKLAFQFDLLKKPCATCPFKKNRNGILQNVELVNIVVQRNLFNSQQMCHHPWLNNKKETHRCKGYFDYAEEIYKRIGYNTETLFLNSKNTTNGTNRKNIYNNQNN